MAVLLARTPIVSRLLTPASDSPSSGTHISSFSGRFPCFFGSNVLGGDDSHAGRLSRQAPCVSGNEPSASGRCGIVSMAHPRRQQMVAQQIKRELSEMMLYDKVLREAVVPEAALGADMYLSSVATVSEVELSGDLQVRQKRIARQIILRPEYKCCLLPNALNFAACCQHTEAYDSSMIETCLQSIRFIKDASVTHMYNQQKKTGSYRCIWERPYLCEGACTFLNEAAKRNVQTVMKSSCTIVLVVFLTHPVRMPSLTTPRAVAVVHHSVPIAKVDQ